MICYHCKRDPRPGVLLADRVLLSVCKATGQHPEDVRTSRKREACRARSAAYWVLRQFGYSFPQVGQLFDRDHTTILYGVRRFEGALSTGRQWARDLLASLE